MLHLQTRSNLAFLSLRHVLLQYYFSFSVARNAKHSTSQTGYDTKFKIEDLADESSRAILQFLEEDRYLLYGFPLKCAVDSCSTSVDPRYNFFLTTVHVGYHIDNIRKYYMVIIGLEPRTVSVFSCVI